MSVSQTDLYKNVSDQIYQNTYIDISQDNTKQTEFRNILALVAERMGDNLEPTKFKEDSVRIAVNHFANNIQGSVTNLHDSVAAYYSSPPPTAAKPEWNRELQDLSFQYPIKPKPDYVLTDNTSQSINSYRDFRKDQGNAIKSMYQNTGFNNERENIITLLLDSADMTNPGFSTANNTLFEFDLGESLEIDKLSNVFLDNFTTYDCISNTATGNGNMGFLLEVDQFNINTIGSGLVTTSGDTTSTDTKKNNKLFIPNDASANEKTVVHKGKKFNYVCQLNPCKLNRITGNLTNMDENSIFSSTSPVNIRWIAEFRIESVEKMNWS